MPQEAIIGIFYVVASALAILVADCTPRRGEAIHDILVGSLVRGQGAPEVVVVDINE